MAEKKPEEDVIETAPDPDEDDLDDLDDVLDEFQSTSISSKPTTSSKPAASSTAPAASGPGRPTDQSGDDADPSEAEFAKQLETGMSNLISELDSNPEMQKQFEQMMQELIAAGAAPTNQEAGKHLKAAAQATPTAPPTAGESAPSKSATPSKKGGQEDFNETIRKIGERMQASDAAAASTTTGAEPSEDALLAQMMKELQNGGGEGGEEDFNKMLLNMMTQLTNKEILYEPMKELHEKFPSWMEKNKDKTGKADLERYQEQQKLVAEIVGRFERKGYSDNNENDRDYIVERMQKMQSAGSPPPDLVGDMSAAQEALGDLDAGCPTQ